MVHINFGNSSPVPMSLEEIEVALRCLSRCCSDPVISSENLSIVDRAVAAQLERRLAGVRADMVKKLVGAKY